MAIAWVWLVGLLLMQVCSGAAPVCFLPTDTGHDREKRSHRQTKTTPWYTLSPNTVFLLSSHKSNLQNISKEHNEAFAIQSFRYTKRFSIPHFLVRSMTKTLTCVCFRSTYCICMLAQTPTGKDAVPPQSFSKQC